MTEYTSSRKRKIQDDLGINDAKEQSQLEKAKAKEEERRLRKAMRQAEIESSASYRMTKWIANTMDKYFLDPILGFVPGFGDTLTSVMSLPSIYVSLFQVKSILLTLAVIFNILKDALIGMIPFWIGNICDFFNRCYLQNMRLIVGFVEDDKAIIDEVNRKSVWMAILIVIFCFLIYLMVLLVRKVVEWVGSWF